MYQSYMSEHLQMHPLLSSSFLFPSFPFSSLLVSSCLVSCRLVSSLLFSSLLFPSLFSSLLFSFLLSSLFFSSLLFSFLLADVNECDTGNGGCDHNCTNVVGSYACSCNEGFFLDGNLHTCLGKEARGEWRGVCVCVCLARNTPSSLLFTYLFLSSLLFSSLLLSSLLVFRSICGLLQCSSGNPVEKGPKWAEILYM